MGTIPVASRIQSVQSAAANARRSIDESDAFDGKDADASSGEMNSSAHVSSIW
jgi:hypothetical protein